MSLAKVSTSRSSAAQAPVSTSQSLSTWPSASVHVVQGSPSVRVEVSQSTGAQAVVATPRSSVQVVQDRPDSSSSVRQAGSRVGIGSGVGAGALPP